MNKNAARDGECGIFVGYFAATDYDYGGPTRAWWISPLAAIVSKFHLFQIQSETLRMGH